MSRLSMSATGIAFVLCVPKDGKCKMRPCLNYPASSVLLSECIGKPGSDTTRHIFMHTIKRIQRFSASSKLKWHAGCYRRVSAAWSKLGLNFTNELLVDWERLQTGRPALPIDPLK